jgi:hypothetical protein
LEGDIHDRKVDEGVELYQYLVNALPENIATTKINAMRWVWTIELCGIYVIYAVRSNSRIEGRSWRTNA